MRVAGCVEDVLSRTNEALWSCWALKPEGLAHTEDCGGNVFSAFLRLGIRRAHLGEIKAAPQPHSEPECQGGYSFRTHDGDYAQGAEGSRLQGACRVDSPTVHSVLQFRSLIQNCL